jgi:hypothetical protein
MNRLFLIWILAIGTIIGASAVLIHIVKEALWQDYASETPAAKFKLATGIPLPSGVTNLKAAGHGLLPNRWIWLTLNATPAAQKKIVSAAEPLSAGDLKYTYKWPRDMSTNPRYDATDKKRVNWENLKLTKSARYYKLSTYDGSWVWEGFVAVDEEHGRIFIHSFAS